VALHGGLDIIFMTDGKETSSDCLAEATAAFLVFLQKCQRQAVVYAIRFTTLHHREFLQDICKMGCIEGMYRYADQDSGELSWVEELFARTDRALEIWQGLPDEMLPRFNFNAGMTRISANTNRLGMSPAPDVVALG